MVFSQFEQYCPNEVSSKQLKRARRLAMSFRTSAQSSSTKNAKPKKFKSEVQSKNTDVDNESQKGAKSSSDTTSDVLNVSISMIWLSNSQQKRLILNFRPG